MLSSFRRMSKSKFGTAIIGLIGVLILIGFAMGDIQNVIQGGSFGGSSDTLVKVGSDSVSDRDMQRAMERRLSQVRQQNPEADYSSIAGDFDQLLSALVDSRAIGEFARKFGFVSAGGGKFYTQTIRALPEGARVWVNIPQTGYVGVGLVTRLGSIRNRGSAGIRRGRRCPRRTTLASAWTTCRR